MVESNLHKYIYQCVCVRERELVPTVSARLDGNFIKCPLSLLSTLQVGNMANDGIKLATSIKEQRCSMAPHDGLEEESRGGTLRALWTHGGPTAAFVHIVIAMCLLLPRLLLEARIIENGLLPRGN